MSFVSNVLRDPFVHFTVLGVGVFVWFNTLNPQDEDAGAETEIVIRAEQIPALAERFQASLQRTASPQDMQGMLTRLVREEILVREARMLSLDQNDPVIRQRLVQKMSFLTDAAAQSAVPTPEELQTFFEQTAAEYEIPPKVTFRQVFLGDQPEQAANVIEQLDAGGDPQTLGVATMLSERMADASPRAVQSTFGRGFFEEIVGLEVGGWHGPVLSTFGAHVVQVEQVTPARAPVLSDIQDEVLAEWRRAQSDALKEDLFDDLQAQYSISMPDMAQIRAAMGL